jgi:hypothetical protein
LGRSEKMDYHITDYEEVSIIGSGGNINKLKMSGKSR